MLNWLEVYFVTLRETGQERADQVAHLISTLPIHIVRADLELGHKNRPPFLSPVKNCLMPIASLLPLAKHARVELVTGDKEFRQVEGDVKILWL